MSRENTPSRGSSIHNPFPASLASECEKASQILDSFVNPRFVKVDNGIPRKILAKAKGLVIITSLRVGFLGSGRFGSGLIIARLPNGGWSTPSALMTAGGGFGGLIGFELTDFVFVLTTDDAVRTLATNGSLTLGGNVSVAAGPVGRSAEAAGAASKKGMAGMLSYSKTRGVYAGVSLEGGVLGERADANKKMYGRRITAKELLRGDISPPPETASLMRVLNSPYFSSVSPGVSPVGSAPELPSNNIHEQRAELPPQPPNQPPPGIPELHAQASSYRAELGTGAPHEVFELSSGEPEGATHELDSAVSPSSQLHAQNTGDTWPPSVSPLTAADMQHTAHGTTGH